MAPPYMGPSSGFLNTMPYPEANGKRRHLGMLRFRLMFRLEEAVENRNFKTCTLLETNMEVERGPGDLIGLLSSVWGRLEARMLIWGGQFH